MQEIKVNDYIRTIDGYIRKVTQVNKKGTYEGICYGAYSVDKPYKNSQGISAKKIKSHSKDIIDLIECGDYVNGKEVVYNADAGGMYNGHKTIDVSISNDNSTTWTIIDTEIKSIVTHEQFNQMKYIVGE